MTDNNSIMWLITASPSGLNTSKFTAALWHTQPNFKHSSRWYKIKAFILKRVLMHWCIFIFCLHWLIRIWVSFFTFYWWIFFFFHLKTIFRLNIYLHLAHIGHMLIAETHLPIMCPTGQYWASEERTDLHFWKCFCVNIFMFPNIYLWISNDTLDQIMLRPHYLFVKLWIV